MNAREQIVRVLEDVFEQGAYSNIALNQALEHSQLSDKDRSFVTEVVCSCSSKDTYFMIWPSFFLEFTYFFMIH